jgi:hypothetical protein
MLDDLLKERSAGAKNWQDMQKKMTQARAGLRMDR